MTLLFYLFKSKRSYKKFAAVLVDNNKIMFEIHFGDLRYDDYRQHRSEKRKNNYLARAMEIKDQMGRLTRDKILSPNWWSIHVLWNKKTLAESIKNTNEQFNVNIKIARIFNTYGPNMSLNDGRVVSNFIVQALRSEDITIYGDGSQTRSFCYVDDLVDGLIKLMESPGSVHGPINLGNPTERTVKNLADLVIAKTKSKSKVIFHELPQDDPKQRKPDVSKAREILNWEPKIDIDQGLENTIKYFKTKV
jgi:nucleoside-diphosphate-sugar epimerase